MKKLLPVLRALVLIGFASLSLSSLAQTGTTAAGKWEYTTDENGLRNHSYTATMPLLGKPTLVTVNFYCYPRSTKDIQGALGMDVYVANIGNLKPFSFMAFEGPDADTQGKKLLQVAVDRPSKKPYVIDVLVNGWSPHEKNFAFGISAESRLVKSTERSILQMIADDAERIQFTLTDPKNPKLKLEVLVPVAGKQAEFKALLKGLK
jgi:hypothetical protein